MRVVCPPSQGLKSRLRRSRYRTIRTELKFSNSFALNVLFSVSLSFHDVGLWIGVDNTLAPFRERQKSELLPYTRPGFMRL